MMSPTRRALLSALPLAMPALLPGTSRAAGFPERVVTIVNGFAAGGSSDIAARIAAPRLSARLGQPVIVENRPGAGGALALSWIRRQPADGYTVIIADPSSLVIAPLVQPDTVTYRPTEDFTPLAIWGTTPMVLVVAADHPARDVAGLLAWLAAQRGRAAYASSGIGSTPQLAAELFLQRIQAATGADPSVTHVPYRGGGQMLEAVMKNEVGFGFAVLSSAAGHVRGGTLRALAVSGPSRSAGMPDVPTMAEAGIPNFTVQSWCAFGMPAGAPPAIVARASALMQQVANEPATKERFLRTGAHAIGSSPDGVWERARRERPLWQEMVRISGARLE